MQIQTFENLTYISLVAAAISLILSLLNFYRLWELKALKKKFFEGSDGLNLEDALRVLDSDIQTLHAKSSSLEEKVLTLKNDFAFGVQKIGLIKFNPFENGGGNFSFSLALLDGQNSGIVITSMHGRDHNRIYSKKISKGKSDVQLTQEELRAISEATK